jgi:large subunit ribosomal protein L21
MYAVIKAGGKQYKVASGDVIEVDRIGSSVGDEVTFEPVLLVDDGKVKARPADLGGVKVTGKVVAHKRGVKIRVFNYHRKTGWKKTRGHRQELTTVEITGIATTPQSKATPAPEATAQTEAR